MADFTMGSVPSDKKRGWAVKIDGQPIEGVGKIEIESKFGKFEYGLRPEGYDSWVFREAGGGGAITLPFTRFANGDLYVGLINENRPNMGGEVLCAIGGFIKVGESHPEAQKREAIEEAGLNSATAIELPGLPVCSNRLFFVANAEKGEGVHVFAVEIPPMYADADEFGVMRYSIPEEDRPRFGKIANVILLPVNQAIRRTADALALSAIARLTAHLS